MPDVKWVGKHIEVKPPKKPKKITGTRFATLLGLNPWSTPFEIWCEVTKTYQKPFEDTIYTQFGKIVEPKQASYMEQSYGMSIMRPSDIWGEDYFKKTYGDFFKDVGVFGGMWDYLLTEDGKPTAVLEMKTSKRVEDWEYDVPEYYALQASLYAYLLDLDDVIMVASFPENADYENPEGFVPNATNTITVSFKVSERYPNFPELVERNLTWWNDYVLTGISPDFDEKKDAEILKALRTNIVENEDDISKVLARAEELSKSLEESYAKLAAQEKELDGLKKMIKEYAQSQFRDGDTKVSLRSPGMTWELSRSTSYKLDEAKLAEDGLLDKYKTKATTSFKLTSKSDK